MAKDYDLWIYYPVGKDGHEWGSWDDRIVEAVGEDDFGRGTDVCAKDPYRDLSFSFTNKREAERAAKRVRKLKIRGVKIEIYERDDNS